MIRLFTAYRLLLDTLKFERAERQLERTRHQSEMARVRAERDREWNRANEAESRLREIEKEARFNLARLNNLPLSPSEVVEFQNARARNQAEPVAHPFRPRAQAVAQREMEARQRAEELRAQEAQREKEQRMQEEAQAYAQVNNR